MSTALARQHPHAVQARAAFHADIVEEVARAVASDHVVIIGMAQNPVCKKVRRYLDTKGVKYTYLSYGSYLSQWRRRLAIKLWAGWPTFPMVFIDGALIGGCSDLEALDKAGELAPLLSSRAS